jgi:hypothetical protein
VKNLGAVRVAGSERDKRDKRDKNLDKNRDNFITVKNLLKETNRTELIIK